MQCNYASNVYRMYLITSLAKSPISLVQVKNTNLIRNVTCPLQNGLFSLMITGSEIYTWYPNLGESVLFSELTLL
jgi:hypothetical protein